MKFHYLQHVPFEDLGSMHATLLARGHSLSVTRFYAGDALPAIGTFDVLIVMGGPMGISDYADHPWLEQERGWIGEVIDAGVPVLGVCLGAQFIASALGARVYPNAHREIGWFPIRKSPEAAGTTLNNVFPEQMDVFHWHGDTFDLPEGAQLLASSAACRNQGFVYRDRVFALQFHLETTLESARRLIEHCSGELDGSEWVQSADQILARPERFNGINQTMDAVLDQLERIANNDA